MSGCGWSPTKPELAVVYVPFAVLSLRLLLAFCRFLLGRVAHCVPYSLTRGPACTGKPYAVLLRLSVVLSQKLATNVQDLCVRVYMSVLGGNGTHGRRV